MKTKLDVFSSSAEPTIFQGITYLRELWRPDLFDVEAIHRPARIAFEEQVALRTSGDVYAHGAILVIKGEGGSGKTHLLRAFRNSLHGNDQGFLAYLTMTTELDDYAVYLLRQVVDSFSEPFWAPYNANQSCLSKLVTSLVALLPVDIPDRIVDETARPAALLEAVDHLQELPRFAGVQSDLLHVLLHLLVPRQAVHNRVAKWLRLEQGLPGEFDDSLSGAVGSPATADAARSRLVQLARLVRGLPDGRMLTICVDQFEDFYDPTETSIGKFRSFCETIRLLAEEMPGTVFVVSILQNYWEKLRQHVTASTLARFEHEPPPVELKAARSKEEVRAIVRERLAFLWTRSGLVEDLEGEGDGPDALEPFSMQDLDELGGQTAREVLFACEAARIESRRTKMPPRFARVLVDPPEPPNAEIARLSQAWNDFSTSFPTPEPMDERALHELVGKATELALEEAGLLDAPVAAEAKRIRMGSAPWLVGRFCESTPRFGHLAREVTALESAAKAENGAAPVVLRTLPFPSNPGTAIRKRLDAVKEAGGRCIAVSTSDLRLLSAMRAFRSQEAASESLSTWASKRRPISEITSISQILQLIQSKADQPVDPVVSEEREAPPNESHVGELDGSTGGGATSIASAAPLPSESDGAFVIGYRRGLGATKQAVTLDPGYLARHAVFLGAPGSGKTTSALRVVEALSLRGVPAILIDRKGDLASYVMSERYKGQSPEATRLRERIEVHLFTPGNLQGRPVALPLLPGGIPSGALDEEATFAAYAVGALRQWSASSDEKVAAVKLAMTALSRANPSQPVLMSHLVDALADPDVVAEVAGYGDIMARVRRELSTALVLNQRLFRADLEHLDPATLLSAGQNGRARVNVISLAFLDNASALFWLSQLLGMLHRHLQRVGSPSTGALNGVLFLDEADIYIPASNQRKPPTKEPLYRGLMQWRAFGFGVLIATQSPGNLDGKVRDQVSTWFLGKINNTTSLGYLVPVLEGSGYEPGGCLPQQGTGEFVVRSEDGTHRMVGARSAVLAKPVPLDVVEGLSKKGAFHPDKTEQEDED